MMKQARSISPTAARFCSWYAARSDEPEENMKHVELRAANRPAGGAITYFTTAPGPMTLARLFRENGRYHMGIVSGETVDISPIEYEKFVKARGSHQLPTAFLKLDVDIEKLISNFGSNHILGVAGKYTQALVHWCKMMGITPVFFRNGNY
jgi:L-fucose isomerase